MYSSKQKLILKLVNSLCPISCFINANNFHFRSIIRNKDKGKFLFVSLSWKILLSISLGTYIDLNIIGASWMPVISNDDCLQLAASGRWVHSSSRWSKIFAMRKKSFLSKSYYYQFLLSFFFWMHVLNILFCFIVKAKTNSGFQYSV